MAYDLIIDCSSPGMLFHFPRVRVTVNDRKDKSISLNKSWIVQWRESIVWNYCTVIGGFTWEIKIIDAQTLGNNNVSNSYLQKLVLYYLKGGRGKTFSEELLQIWKACSFVSIYQVDDDIIDINMMIIMKVPILWLLFIIRG